MYRKLVEEYFTLGKEKEKEFAQDLLLSEGGKLLPVTEYEDIGEHIDLRWFADSTQRTYTFDVKSARKTNRYDNNVSYDSTWLEILNVNKERGSLYGKQNFIAFELKESWIIVRREDLVNNLYDRITDPIIYRYNPKSYFKFYTRPNRSDLIVQVPMTFIEEYAIKYIKKQNIYV